MLAYLLDLTKDGVGGLDLPFAQLPQGHLLKVNLRRQGHKWGALCRMVTEHCALRGGSAAPLPRSSAAPLLRSCALLQETLHTVHHQPTAYSSALVKEQPTQFPPTPQDQGHTAQDSTARKGTLLPSILESRASNFQVVNVIFKDTPDPTLTFQISHPQRLRICSQQHFN